MVAFDVLDTGDQVASVVSCLVGIAALCITWLGSRRFGPVDEAREAACAAELSTGALERLRREASTHGLVFPEPLRIPWWSVGGPYAANPDVVLGRLPGVRRTALRLRGDVTTLADTVHALPARQVVITGAAGSGKTSAAVLLALRIVREGEAALLVDMVDWDPERHSLNDWLAACLTAARPASLPVEDARATALRMVERGAVVPVLDGLDELPDHLMTRVIESVHEWDHPFVLTSRTGEYETAVRTTGLTVAKALVVRLGPMPISEIATHLTAGRADADRRWASVMARLRTPGPLREVLSTPLMSGMARTAYTRVDSDPTELLESDNVTDLEHHLLDRVYPHDGAFAWLTPLARFLDQRDVRQFDLCGSLIPATWSKLRQRALSSMVITCYLVFVGLFVRFVRFDWSGRLIDTLLAVTLWAGLGVGFLIVRLATRSRIEPVMPYRFRARPRRMLSVAAVSAAAMTVFTVIGTGSISIPSTDVTRLVLGTAAISLIAAVVGAMAWGSLTEPVAEGETPHPLSAIRWDGWALLAHFPAPLLGTAVYLAPLQQLNTFPQTAALALIVSTTAFDQVPGAAWSRWMVRRLRLAGHRLPPDLEESLENARARGILRATGTSYRFQHAKVRDHLAGARDRLTRSETVARHSPTRPTSGHAADRVGGA
jgi:hypothetical protein